MSKTEQRILDIIKQNDTKMVRLWAYYDAPKELQELASMKQSDIRCVAVVHEDALPDVGDWLGDLLYASYVEPDWNQFGDYNVYIVYN